MKEKYLNLASRGLVILIIFYTLFLLGKSLWTNYQLKQSIVKLHSQIATLEQQKKDMNNLILYYQTDSFKELEARRKLGLKKPEEKVFLVGTSAAPTSNFEEEITRDKSGAESKNTPAAKPNWLLWYEYFAKAND